MYTFYLKHSPFTGPILNSTRNLLVLYSANDFTCSNTWNSFFESV